MDKVQLRDCLKTYGRPLIHLVIHKSCIFHLACLNCGGGIHGKLKSDPKRFGSRLAIALATKEAAQRCDQTDHLVKRRRARRACFLRQQIGASDLIGMEEQRCTQGWTVAAQAHEPCDAPRHNHVQHHGPFHPAHLRQCEILKVLGAVVLTGTSPLTPMQLLWVNLLSNMLLAIALAAEPPEEDVMRQPPRDSTHPLVGSSQLLGYARQGAWLTAGTLGACLYGMARYGTGPHRSALAFNPKTLGQLLHALTCCWR